jgi:hypothetical protein
MLAFAFRNLPPRAFPATLPLASPVRRPRTMTTLNTASPPNATPYRQYASSYKRKAIPHSAMWQMETGQPAATTRSRDLRQLRRLGGGALKAVCAMAECEVT